MTELKTQINTKAMNQFVFSELEAKILQMIAFEHNFKEIEMEVRLTSNALHTLLFKMYRKLGVNTRIGLIRAAFEKGLLILY